MPDTVELGKRRLPALCVAFHGIVDQRAPDPSSSMDTCLNDRPVQLRNAEIERGKVRARL